MSKAQRDAAKDHGGFVAGVLMGGRRKIDTVEVRSMLALDGDRIDAAFLAGYESLCPYASVLYTTHSSTPDNPRVRLVFPLTRDVTPEEFVAVSRYVAQMLGIDYFDECSYQPNQLMYWPSSPQNGVFVYKETNGEWLNPDDVLSAHPEWNDPTRLPTSSRESKANAVTQQKVQDPLAKEGVVGLFNRVYYPVTRALQEFLSDVYEPTDNENRWHLKQSSSMAGVEIKEDKFVYSHHAKDPAYLKLCNAFDIVRIVLQDQRDVVKVVLQHSRARLVLQLFPPCVAVGIGEIHACLGKTFVGGKNLDLVLLHCKFTHRLVGYARWKEAEEFISQHGSIFQTPSGYVQQVPQVSIAQQNLKIMQSFCSEFGLTPATPARIIANGGGKDDAVSDDPMESLLKGGW